MLKEIVYFLLNMSIMATLMILIAYLLRLISSKWITKRLVFLLWVFVLFRLIVPVSLPSEFSVLQLFGQEVVKSVPMTHSLEVQELINNTGKRLAVFSNYVQGAEQYEPLTYKSNAFEEALEIISYIWLIGVLILLIGIFISFLRVKNQLQYKETKVYDSFVQKALNSLKSNQKVTKNIKVYTSEELSTPLVFGIFTPKIILPKDMNEEFAEFAILHEVAHIKRKDNLWKAIYTLATCIHWFNPFCWLMLKQINKDIELACDEKVIQSLVKDSSKESVKDYALALVMANEKMNGFATAFSSNELEKRVNAIIGYRRLSTVMIVLMVALYLVLGAVLMTNA